MSRDSASALDHVGAAGDDRVTGAGEVDLTSCRWCRQTLPDRENLQYCPFCGQDVRLQPCRDCGETLEPGWKFCIACGTEAEG